MADREQVGDESFLVGEHQRDRVAVARGRRPREVGALDFLAHGAAPGSPFGRRGSFNCAKRHPARVL
jgi:hypothetical protein